MSAPVAPSRIRQCLRCRLDRCPQALGYGSYHVVRRQGPPDPLQLELTHWLDLHQHSRTDEDLSGLRLITQPRGDVGHSADSGVIETPLEADCAERGKA